MSSQQTKKCPICKKEATQAFYPFCSKGCKDVDLNRWLKGGYAIPGEPATAEDIAQHVVEQAQEDNKTKH